MSEESRKTRKNPFCVVSKDTYGSYNVRDIQTNTSWLENPYKDYAVVPDAMVPGIQATRGFCDIELNAEGTEIVSFTARSIPVIETPEQEPTESEQQWQAITDLEIAQMEYWQALTDLEIEVLSNE